MTHFVSLVVMTNSDSVVNESFHISHFIVFTGVSSSSPELDWNNITGALYVARAVRESAT